MKTGNIVLWGIVFLGETLTRSTVAGCAVVMFGTLASGHVRKAALHRSRPTRR